MGQCGHRQSRELVDLGLALNWLLVEDKMDLKDRLNRKKKLLVEKYTGLKEIASITDDELNGSERVLYRSMTRWHKNIHIPDTLKLSLLEEVNARNILDVKENLIIPKALASFLKLKFKQESMKDKFSVNELFEVLLPKIRNIYEIKLEARDEDDEFGLDSMFGTNIEDGMFFERSFMPMALYLVYKEIHNNYKTEEELFNDLFSVGSGSRNLDYLPEITVFCSECRPEHSYPLMEVDEINRKVLKLQSLDNFVLHGVCPSSSAYSERHSDLSTFNPFCQEMEDISDTDSTSFECSVCFKQFSRSDFLDFHMKIFHKTEQFVNESGSKLKRAATKSLAANFVDDEDSELMNTFCKEDSTDNDDIGDPTTAVSPDKEVSDSHDDPILDPTSKSFKETRCPRGVRKVLRYPK